MSTRSFSPIVTIDAESPDSAAIDRAASIIAAGKPLIYPTRALYGLGVDAFRPFAVDRVFDIKGRPKTNPVSVLIHRREAIEALVKHIPTAAVAIIDGLWPGGITLVFEAADRVPANLTGGTGKIGIRLPQHPVARALLTAVKTPITATSANRSGEPGGHRIDQLPAAVIEQAAMVLNAGPLSGGPGSTVVDVTVDPPDILRPGTVPADSIRAVVNGSA